MGFEILCPSETAKRAIEVASKLNLDARIYSYSDILAEVTNPKDFIKKCAEVTGTKYADQLKFSFAADGPFPRQGEREGNPVIGVVSYEDMLDYRKLADILKTYEIYPELTSNKLSSRKVDLDTLGFKPGLLGMLPYFTYSGVVHDNREFRGGQLPIPYIIDKQIKDFSSICFPTGRGNDADELVVIEGQTVLGKSLDRFLTAFGISEFHFADIARSQRA
jgi:hypothetical protein